MEMYKSEEVTDAIIQSKMSQEIREHAEARGVTAARQYLCCIQDDTYKEIENLEECGFSGQGEVGDDQASKDALKNFIPDDHFKGSGLLSADRPKTKAELDAEEKKDKEKKEERERKKQERLDRLENDMEKRTQNWLNGINKDLVRLSTNLSDINKVPDDDTKDVFYSALFVVISLLF